MDFSTMTIGYWLVLLLVAAAGVYFGYRIGRGKQKTGDAANMKLLQDENAQLLSDLEASNQKLTARSDDAKTTVTPPSKLVVFDASAARAALGKNVKQDDLKIIEGIGPKIETMFKTAGITTWQELSETAVAQCHEILKRGGKKYKIHDPASWPMQARMCYEGKWTALARWQNEHDYGKW